MARMNDPFESPHRHHVLSPSQVRRIHLEAQRILDVVGIEVQSSKALDLLREAGAEVADSRVRIPGNLIEEAIRSAPKSVLLYTRDGQRHLTLEGRKCYFGAYGGPDQIFDVDTGKRRRATREDTGSIAKVCDYLPEISWVMVAASGAPGEFHAALLNTSKPLYCPPHNLEDQADIIEMCSIVAGGTTALREKPFYIRAINSSSPLVYTSRATDLLLFMTERRLPVIFNAGLFSCGTTPATLAGTLVVGVAENLAGLVISQLHSKGTPVIMGGVASVMDMLTGISSYGAPELSLMMSAYADVIHSYGIPVYGTAGCSDSKSADEQAAIESTLSIVAAAQSGANLIHDVGVVDISLTASLEAFVMGNEIIAMVRRGMSELQVNLETLACEVLQDVGPGGHFLDHPHTLRHFREQYRSPLIDRQRYDAWLQAGGLTMHERIREQVRTILREHSPDPLPEDMRRELARIVERADARAATTQGNP